MGSPDWNVSIVNIYLQKLLWVYCPGHAGMKGNDQADRLAGKATLTSGLLLGRSEVLRSLRHHLRAQSQGQHTIDRLDERGMERVSARWTSLKGREIWEGHHQSDKHWNCFKGNIGETFFKCKATLGKFFQAHRYRLELNWTHTCSAVQWRTAQWWLVLSFHSFSTTGSTLCLLHHLSQSNCCMDINCS